jgi:hypothetical protein
MHVDDGCCEAMMPEIESAYRNYGEYLNGKLSL